MTIIVNSQNFKNSDELEKWDLIGEHIYEYIEKLTDEDSAQKITGMIIDLPIDVLLKNINTYEGLLDKIKEGKELLKD